MFCDILLLGTLLGGLSNLITAAPVSECLSNPSCGPIPGESPLYQSYNLTTAPWPGNTTGAILNITAGPAGEDDLLFQNLLSAEWVIFSFYQQGVEAFNESAFTSKGFLNTTYQRISEIRDNENGHLRIFQDQISTNTIKPGPCKYKFPFTDVTSYLALQTIIEVSSMAFLTGLELQARLTTSRSALVAIAATETRHETWSLIDNWNADPFAGPSDTVFPYANQILGYLNQWIVPDSCPAENPVFPSPNQNLPQFAPKNTTKSIAPGAEVEFVFADPSGHFQFKNNQSYYAVFFHGVLNVSVPFDTKTNSTKIPSRLDPLGIYEVVIATKEGAPTKEDVVAGPSVLLETPSLLSSSTYS